jgi:hypothetical protein
MELYLFKKTNMVLSYRRCLLINSRITHLYFNSFCCDLVFFILYPALNEGERIA